MSTFPCTKARRPFQTLVAIAALGAASIAAAGPYQEAVLDTNPVAYWTLNEAAGTAVDASGNGLDATPQGDPGYGIGSLLPSGEGAAVALGTRSSTGTSTSQRFACAPRRSSAWAAQPGK